MKKLVKILMVALMAITVAACGSSDSGKNSGKETIKYTIGVSPDYPPYESLDTDNNVIGFDADMVALFPTYLETDDTVYEFEWVQMDFDNIVTQIQAGQIDFGISGFTYSEDRKVEWSDPYTATSQVAVIKSNSDITSADDLKGKLLAAQTSATGEMVANDIENAEVNSLKDVKMIFQGLKADQYDAAIVDLAVAQQYVKENDDLKMIDQSLLDEKNYIIAKEGNKDGIKLINKALKKFLASDDYNTLCDKYGLKKLED